MTWPEWVEHVGSFTLAKVVGWVVGIIAAFTILSKAVRGAWPWLKRAIKLVDALTDLPERLDRIEESQAAARHELTDNHGSSLKDAVKRIEGTVRDVKRDLDVHIEFCKQREKLLGDNDGE